MKRHLFLLAALALIAPLTAHAGGCCVAGAQAGNAPRSGGHGGKTVQAELPKPTLVEAVDTTKHTITIGREGAEPETFTYDAFTRVFVNGKAGKIDEVQSGMKVSIAGSAKKASRIDADSYTPPKKK